MDLLIGSIDDLRAEILRLKEAEREKSIALSERFRSPSAVFSTVMTIFPKQGDGVKKSSFFDQDIVGLISRVALPFTLNKTLFRHSNFIVKALVGLVSQKASHFITEDAVTGVWGKVTSLFKGKPKERRPRIDKPVYKGPPPAIPVFSSDPPLR